MRILYLSASELPSRRASSIQVMEMCHAFASEEHDVMLVAKGVPGKEEGVHAFYGLPETFAVRLLSRPKWKGGGLIYGLAMRRLIREEHARHLVYSRDYAGAWMASRSNLPFVFEAHQLPPGKLAMLLYRSFSRSRQMLRLVTITEQLRVDFEAHGLVPRGVDAVVAPSAVNPDKLSAPRRPELNDSTVRVGYVGNLYAGRGYPLIVELARSLPEVSFHIVGARKEDAKHQSEALPPNLVFHGFVRPDAVGEYYAAFDILVMPHQDRVMAASGRTDIARWCSPIKLFEYMASGKAIIASDLPVLGEVLRDGENAVIVPAKDVRAWVDAVSRLARDERERQRLGNAARRECLSRYTWRKRVEIVLGESVTGPPASERHGMAKPVVSAGGREGAR